jgi:uncharacterized pyridoxal phosphate-containing UPF0001 family protein
VTLRVDAQVPSALAARLSAIDERIADGARAARRDPGEITRIVVTKFHPASLVRDLHGLGVDRGRFADALHRAADGDDLLDVLVQINLTDDAGRGGVVPAEAVALAEHVLTLPSLRLRGVMAVAPLDEEPAAAFARLREIADSIRAVEPSASWISAGMTGDFVEAIAAGATHLRIGSAITGPRPDRG